MEFTDRLKHAWNVFSNKDPSEDKLNFNTYSNATFYRPDRHKSPVYNERTIVVSVYNRIALDAASLNFRHCRLDENGRYKEIMDTYLNDCLNVEANLDQASRLFIQDVVISMLDEGCVAIVPTETSLNPNQTAGYDIQSMRVGQILEWMPNAVKVKVYNEQTGEKEDITIRKSNVAIVENPLFAVMNEPNSTMQRLIRKLRLLDIIDEQSGAGKLDLIIQLPYVVKSQARAEQAEKRRKAIEDQLANTKYGIAYTDGTEKITQLNRSVENNLMKQIEYLTSMLYSQLGITQAVLDGSAKEDEMLNYYNRTIEPIIAAVVDEMKRKFLSKTARTQGQSIIAYREPFKLVPTSELAELADKFTRNEIMTSNEIRQVIGMKPSDDPKADELVNSNLNQPEGQALSYEQGYSDGYDDSEVDEGGSYEDYSEAEVDYDEEDSRIDGNTLLSEL